MSPILEVEYIGLLGNYNNSQSGILYIMDEWIEDRTQGRQRKETKEAPVDREKRDVERWKDTTECFPRSSFFPLNQ